MTKLLICQTCNKCFDRVYDYERHINNQGNCANALLDTEDKNDTNKISYNCETCGKEFASKQSLMRHLDKAIKCKKEKKYIINNNQTIKQINYINNNINNIQPIINNNNVQFVKHGKETIGHITKEVLLRLLNQPSFTWLCTEFMRMLYFNAQAPQNNNWCIAYPKNEEAGVVFDYKEGQFERKSTTQIIDDKFSNMMDLLYPILSEIHDEDEKLNNLNAYQKKNIKKYFGLYGVTEISTESTEIYNSVHKMAFRSRRVPMTSWRNQGLKGNHLSLKF